MRFLIRVSLLRISLRLMIRIRRIRRKILTVKKALKIMHP